MKTRTILGLILLAFLLITLVGGCKKKVYPAYSYEYQEIDRYAQLRYHV